MESDEDDTIAITQDEDFGDPVMMIGQTTDEARSRTTSLEPFFIAHHTNDDYDLPLRSPEPTVPREPVYTPKDIIEKLNTLSKADDCEGFKHSLLCYLCEVVPTLFIPVDDLAQLLTPLLDHNKIESVILIPIQSALVGGESKDFNEEIARSDVPNGSCGRIFKSGESTYSCRDCGADPTCVLCNECFNHSGHRNHRYKISSSNGGGYCDCGDFEAWKEDVFCSKHRNFSDSAGSTLLPNEEKIATWVLETLLHYANGVLSNDYAISADSIPIIRNCVGEALESILHYSLILYNDEVHTFEIVIHALTRVLKMDKKQAADFTNKIHNEGRAVVRTTVFEICAKLRDEIVQCTRHTSGKPLRVQIHQSALVAHQRFAEYIIDWITGLLNKSSSYRNIFHKIVSTPMSDSRTFLQTILLNDTKAWKHVRETWHHLLIAGLLKEYSIKKDFATVFADAYGELMAEFSQDDHDHAFSVTSLTVQIFTVPSLAHYLLERGLFFNLMRTILSEVEPRLKNGKLQYERTGPGFQMRRTQYSLVDLKYLLTSVPKPWTTVQRRTFVDGFSSLVKFCTFLQESDPVIRQIGDHVEFEPDWEIAFNTHARLAPVLILVGEWCGSDKDVMIRCYRNVLRELAKLEKEASLETIVREVADHSATCYVYDVSRLPVSIYLALTRLFAGLFIAVNKLYSTQQEIDALTRCLVAPTPEYLMEAPLRTLTLVAQRYVGMWKRNGFSLLNQLYFYQNVRCRGDMFDKDILSLQIAATQIESNEFLIHILNKFNILQWLEEGFDKDPPNEEDNLSFTVLLVEEFLLLIIILINGRFLPGVAEISPEDCIRKQIIQFLSIGPMTHSELNRFLEEDIHGETGIEEVVRDIADLKKTANGDLYELRPEYHGDYDVFYYHYIREEMSKAEETQRARKIAAKEPDVFPPPVLPPLTSSFAMLINLLQADVLLCVFQTTIKRCLQKRSRSYSDAQLRKVLHLIGYGLNEELERRKVDTLNFFQFTDSLDRWNIIKLLQAALTHPRAATHKEMILWIIQTIDQIRPSNSADTALQQVQQQELDEAEIRKQKAAAAKARAMGSISNLQRQFRTVNADLFDEQYSVEESCEMTQTYEAVCLGPARTPQSVVGEELTCILCMDKQDPFSSTFVIGSLIQRSTVLAQKTDCTNGSRTPPIPGSHQPFVIGPDMSCGLFVGSCGHVMHKTCWKKHHQNIVTRERRRPFRQLQLFDIDRNESLCPMCECLHNAVIPVLPPVDLPEISVNSQSRSSDEFEKWISFVSFMSKWTRAMRGYWAAPSRDELEELGHADTFDYFWTKEAAIAATQKQLTDDEFLVRIEQESFLPNIVKEDKPEISRNHLSLLTLWSSIAFTITSFELSNREQGIAFFGTDVPSRLQLTLKYLTRVGGAAVSTNNFMQVVAAQLIALRTAKVLCYGPQDQDERFELTAVDPFSLLVTATFSLPYIFVQSGGVLIAKVTHPGTTMDLHIFRSVFFLHMTQLLCQNDFMDFVLSNPGASGVSDNDERGFFEKYCRKIWQLPSTQVDWSSIVRRLEELVMPFISSCCKFYECYTSIEPSHFLPQNTSLSVMLQFLGQPTDLREYFNSPLLLDIGFSYVLGGFSKGNLFPRTIQQLTELPSDYLDLINYAADFSCESNRSLGYESRHPTICLLCGKLLCSQSACCFTEVDGQEVGACAYHLKECGLGTGLFLRIRDCKAFLLTAYGKKGTYVSPPYVDDYGETDQGLRRGNPLRLSREKYEYLRKLWINHTIPEEIVRLNERNQSVPSIHYTIWTQF